MTTTQRIPVARRRVLVTGGTSGIGLALAEALVEAGAHVMICGRDADRLARAAHSLGVESARCDVGQPTALPALLEEVDATLGGLDILINNAGIQNAVDFGKPTDAHASMAAIAREVAVNLTGPLQLTRLAVPLLTESSPAAVVFMGSALALTPKQSAPVYCATKAGLHNAAQTLRAQLAPRGIHIMEVVPPMVDTPMLAGRPEARSGRRVVSPERVARETLRGLDRGRPVVRVGAARVLAVLHRLLPGTARRMMLGASAVNEPV